MDKIKQIRISENHFIIDSKKTSLKLKYFIEQNEYVIDISSLNLINATKFAVLCSTYFFINNFKKKICWLVANEEIKKNISILKLRNTNQKVINKKEITLVS